MKRDPSHCVGIALLVCVLFALKCMAYTSDATGSNEAATVPRVSSPIKIDGLFSEEGWQNALVLELPYETSPGENIPASLRTEVRIVYDNNFIYFALKCFDPHPESIRARYSDRDNIIGDDLIHVNLDTFNDERRNYFFGVNALGIQRDGIETNQGNLSWDAIWDAAGQITEWGYAIEIALPFSSLQFQRSQGNQTWGLDISRLYPRSMTHRFGLVPIDRNNDSYQSQFLKIQGIADVSPGRSIEIAPTVTTVRSDVREDMPDGELQSQDSNVETGLTAKWGVTNNLVLSSTLNPDFSQVEADAYQLDINQPFALSFQEKRPFFTEGADFFSTQADIVYTRAIRDPDWGVKLTGKEGANSLGAFYVRDTITNLIFPGPQGSSSTSLKMESDVAALRYKRDFGNKYTFGAIVTNRQGDNYYNRVVGVDGNIRISDVDRLSIQVLGSSTRYPDATAAEFDQPTDSFSDSSVNLEYDHSSRNWNWWGGVWDHGEKFRADLGFMPQVGYRHFNAGFERVLIADTGSWWSNIYIGNGYNRLYFQNGELFRTNYNYWFIMQGAWQSFNRFQGRRDTERYNGVSFDINRIRIQTSIEPTGNLELGFLSDFGDRIDYLHTRLGKRLHLNPEISYRFGRNLLLNLDHTYERMNIGPERLYTANISQITVKYQFNPRTFFRTIIQYVDYKYNTVMYDDPPDPKFRHLFTQFLYSYKINPRTVLFLGYSDNYKGNHNYAITQTDRTLFFKLGYAWQL